MRGGKTHVYQGTDKAKSDTKGIKVALLGKNNKAEGNKEDIRTMMER